MLGSVTEKQKRELSGLNDPTFIVLNNKEGKLVKTHESLTVITISDERVEDWKAKVQSVLASDNLQGLFYFSGSQRRVRPGMKLEARRKKHLLFPGKDSDYKVDAKSDENGWVRCGFVTLSNWHDAKGNLCDVKIVIRNARRIGGARVQPSSALV